MKKATIIFSALWLGLSLILFITVEIININKEKQYQKEIATLTEKLQTIEKSYTTLSDLYNELEQSYDTIDTMNSNLNETIQDLREENAVLQNEITDKDEQIEDLKVDLADAQAKKKEREAAKLAAKQVSGSCEGVELQYSAPYNITDNKLTATKGVVYYNGHKECYYTQTLLPGEDLYLPGRHVAEDGTIRDGDGYICVAADLSFLPRYSTVMTSLGPGKVYDTGCRYGTVDIYTDW